MAEESLHSEATIRHTALRGFAILDTPPEAGFDDLALLAAQICGTQTALVSLLDDDRQWFKARVGFEPQQTPLSHSVCMHAAAHPGLLVIPDLRLDPRTATNPVVSGPPHIRFYAGAPLRTAEGVVLGTLCVVDGEPRPQGLTDQQSGALETLARQVMSQMELRRALRDRDEALLLLKRDRTAHEEAERRSRRSEERLSFAFDAAGAAGWWDWDIPSNRVYASPRFGEFFGLDPQAAAAGAPLEVYMAAIDPRDRGIVGSSIQRTMADGGEFTAEYRLALGQTHRWIIARGRCYCDATGQPLRFPGVAIDITERKESERLNIALLALGDRLRQADTVSEVARAFAEITSATLEVGRSGFATLEPGSMKAEIEFEWSAPGLQSIAGQHDLSRFGPFVDDLKKGLQVIVPDVSGDARTQANVDAFAALQIAALINLPMIERGALTGIFFLHHAVPKVWETRDVIFVREAAERARGALTRIRAEERQIILNQELSHRMKNMLTMVQGIATQTLRNAVDLSAARETLGDRLAVFGRAHDILLSPGTQQTDLAQLLEATLSLHEDSGTSRVSTAGPVLEVGRKAALWLALMFHELATNALKYGALSTPEGHVTIAWTVTSGQDAELNLSWAEHGGPEVRTPQRKGFGSRLIERGLGGAVGGTIAITYDPSGVVCQLQIPLAALQSED